MKTWSSPGRGSVHRRPETIRQTIAFDDETHGQVRELAEQSRVSFSEQARQLIEWGLETARKERECR